MDARSVVFALACVLVAITDAASAARGFPGKDLDPGKKSLIRCTHTTKAMNGLIALPSFLKDMVGTTTDAMEVILLFEDNIPIISSVLPSETKFSILDCLGKKNLALFGFGGDPEIRGTKYIIIFFSHRVSSRRYLTDSSSKVSSSFSNGPAIATTSMLKIDLNAHSLIPASTRTTNPFFVPDSGPINFKKPAYSLKALSSSAPVSRFHVGNPRPISPAPAVTIQRDGNVVDVSPASGTFTSSEKHNDSTEAVINAVVITGTVSFALSAIFFYCYIKCCATSRSDNAKSERPLLSLSDFSDVSLGSSPKSFAIGTVMHGDMVGITSLRAHQTPSRPVSSDPDTSLSDISSYVDVSDTYKPSVGIASSVDAPSEPSCPPPPPPPLPQRPPTAKMAPPPNALPPPMINPCPPPPPKGVLPPHPPPPLRKLSPLGPNHSQDTLSNASALGSKTKLKPFFWDKVMANPDQTMVWHQIKSGSFQFNEEMIETLFRYNVTDNLKSEDKKGPSPTGQIVQIIDPKKSQNLAILLRALNMASEDVCLALTDGNELPRELIQTLLKMPPTVEEELKLKLYTGDITQLHTAERLLKALMDIPFAYKRLDSLLFMCSFHEDVVAINESLKTLKAACRELRSSRLFLKLLEAVLKTGNRMNDGTYRGGAQAFKLDTLLKLSDVKGIDGKTTLLHFVVQEIIRTEGIRAARATRGSLNLLGDSPDSDDFVGISQFTRNHYYNLGLKIVSSICDELGNVKKAAALDADTLTSTVANLGCGMTRTKEFLYGDMNKIDSTSGFQQSLQWFVEHAEGDIISLQDEEKSVRALVRSTTDYFHGNAGKDEGLRLFVIVRNFLGMLEKVCNEVRQASMDEPKVLLNKEVVMPQPVTNPWQPLFPAIQKHRLDISSSDEDSS